MSVVSSVVELGPRQYSFLGALVTKGVLPRKYFASNLARELNISSENASKQAEEILKSLVSRGYAGRIRQISLKTRRIFEVDYYSKIGKEDYEKMKPQEVPE